MKRASKFSIAFFIFGGGGGVGGEEGLFQQGVSSYWWYFNHIKKSYYCQIVSPGPLLLEATNLTLMCVDQIH